jgi:hypothetical protein
MIPGKLPFPRWACVTPIKVYQTELSEDGEPKEDLVFDGLCNYSEKSRQIMDAERRLVQLNAKAIIEGDINPGKDIEGYVLVEGTIKRVIHRAARPRNPDGSVFSTELELI